jgi:hypothetical protein
MAPIGYPGARGKLITVVIKKKLEVGNLMSGSFKGHLLLEKRKISILYILVTFIFVLFSDLLATFRA